MIKTWFKISYVRSYLIIGLIFVMQLFSAISVYLTNPQLNFILAGHFLTFLAITGLKFGIEQIANAAFGFSNYGFTKQTQESLHLMRDQIVRHYFAGQQHQVTAMENNLSSNLQLISDDYFQNLFYFINDVLYVVLVAGMLLTFHWILLIVVLLVATLSALVPKWFDKYTNQATQVVSVKNSQFLDVIEKWLLALNEIRRYAIKKQIKGAIGQSSQRLEQGQLERQQKLYLAQLIQDVIDSVGIFGIPLIAGVLYFQGKIPFGAIVTASYLANGIFSSLLEAINSWIVAASTQALRKKTLGINHSATS